MPGFSTPSNNLSDVTPGRRTHVFFDVPDYVVEEPLFQLYRANREIARAGLTPANSSHIERLSDGTLALAKRRLEPLRAESPSAGQISFTAASGWQEKPTFRDKAAELPGSSGMLSAVASGDTFWDRKVAFSGGTTNWGQGQAADEAAFIPYYGPFAGGNYYKLNRALVATEQHGPDTTYTFRYTNPGSLVEAGQIGLVFYFSGPAGKGGSGEYALLITGGGTAYLGEGQRDTRAWKTVSEWRYSEAHHRGAQMFTVRVHAAADNPYIEAQFTAGGEGRPAMGGTGSGSLVQAPLYGGGLSVVQPPGLLYLIPPGGTGRGAGTVRVDVPANIRPQIQVRRHPYETDGWVECLPFVLPFLTETTRSPMSIEWFGHVPDGCSLSGRLYDATTGAELTLVSTGERSRTYAVNAGQAAYYARFAFTGDGFATPVLRAYAVGRQGYLSEQTPGPFEVDVVSVNVTGAELDPTHETATLEIEDVTAAYPRLRVRGAFDVRIETEYDPADATKRSVLFEGRATRVVGSRRGAGEREGATGRGAVKAYPAADWRRFEAQCVGKWGKAKALRLGSRLIFSTDRSDPSLPPKATDICRELMTLCGVPPERIDIPDSPVRVFFSAEDITQGITVQIEPLAEIFNYVVSLLRSYLGWGFAWDGNAGTAGMWRAVRPNRAPYQNLALFTTEGPTGTKLAHRPESYGTAYWVDTDGTNPPTAFIQRGTLSSYTKPPEANAVMVSVAGEMLPNRDGKRQVLAYACNPKSYNFYGEATADPDHPDYLGFHCPLVIVDHSLGQGPQSQGAANWLCRRYYDQTCHGRRMTAFLAPLVLVWDPRDALQTRPRRLRYYDAVGVYSLGVTSQWLVRSANIVYRKSHMQMCRYELESPPA